MLTIMDLLKKDSANKLNKLVESSGQPIAFIVASLLESQLNNAKDGTQSVPRVTETKANNPKVDTTNNSSAPEINEDGIFSTWEGYPKRAAKAFTQNNIKTPKQLIASHTFKMISELHGVGESTAHKVFEKLKEDGHLKSMSEMGKNASPANVASYSTETVTPKVSAPPKMGPAKNIPKFETKAEDDDDAVATDWRGKILDLSPNNAKASLGEARVMFARAWNISEAEATALFKDVGIVASFVKDQSPANITALLKQIVNNLPASSDLIERINETAVAINAFGGKCDIDAIVSEFDKNSLITLTTGEANKVLEELRYELQSFKDAAAHEDEFSGDDEDDEDDDMPF